MSKANETNQTKPEFKIEACNVCPAEPVCCSVTYNQNCAETCKNIEALVNGKR